MTKTLICLTSLTALALCPPLAAQRGRGNAAARNGWLFNYRAAKDRAKKSGKPIMVVIRCVP